MGLNRGWGSGHPSMWFRGAALYCATLATRSIQPGLFEPGSFESGFLKSGLFESGFLKSGFLESGLPTNLANATLANVHTLSAPNPHRLPSSVVREDEH